MWRCLMCILPTSSKIFPPARQTTLTNMRPILLLESVRSGTTSLTTCQSSSFICSDFTPKAKRLSRNWSHSHPSHCRYYQKPTWFARKYVYHDTQVLILLTPTTVTELCRWHRRVSGFPLQMWLFTPEPWPGYVETQSSVFVTIEHPFHLDLMILTLFVRRPTSDVDIFVFPVDPRHLPAKVEGAVAKNKAWNVKKIIQISTV